MKKIGLTLSGGGARGAYEAGVLKAISDCFPFQTCPFQILTGISAGSINAMALAADADRFPFATQKLWDTWTNLKTSDVYDSNVATLCKTALRWIRDLSFGGALGGSEVTHLLNTDPLKKFLDQNIDTHAIAKHIREGRLAGVALSATDYYTGKLVTFFDAGDEVEDWKAVSGIGRRTHMTTQHILASTAIPIFFPPVHLEDSDYGDGGIGLKSPLSSSIRLGADKILVIGLQRPVVERPIKGENVRGAVTLGDIAGTLLNSLFLNAIEGDVARLEQTNEFILQANDPQRLTLKESRRELRNIPILAIEPSADLGHIDLDQFGRFPYPVRYLLNGLGVTREKGWDLLSYLAFDKVYATSLLKLGYEDGLRLKTQLAEFLDQVPSK